MKQIVLTLSLSAAFILGCVVGYFVPDRRLRAVNREKQAEDAWRDFVGGSFKDCLLREGIQEELDSFDTPSEFQRVQSTTWDIRDLASVSQIANDIEFHPVICVEEASNVRKLRDEWSRARSLLQAY